MFGNPYINPQVNIDKINQQIGELERLRNGLQTIPQQPTNIINVGNTAQNDFRAQYLNDNEKVEDLFVNCKTAFIDLKNGQLSVKEINGDITKYELIAPKTCEQLKIEELERKLKEYELRYDNEVNESTTTNIRQDDTSTKTSSRTVPKKS